MNAQTEKRLLKAIKKYADINSFISEIMNNLQWYQPPIVWHKGDLIRFYLTNWRKPS